MQLRTLRIPKTGTTLAGFVGLVLGGQAALAQYPGGGYPPSQPPRIAQTPQSANAPYSDLVGQPAPVGTAATPGADSMAAPTPPGATGMTGTPPGGAGFGGFGSAFSPGGFGAGGGGTTAVADNAGYIDSAIIRTRFRQRYDSAYDMNSPDRAEFFYPKCGCFGNIGNFAQFLSISNVNGVPRLNGVGAARRAGFDPRASGPQHPGNPRGNGGESRIDYQEVSTYLEYAPIPTFSGFIELPARFLNPTLNRNTNGFSDLNLGFKKALVADPDRFYTFQFRTYVPTGSGELGLGTNHPSLEPGFLVFQRMSERLYFMGEVRDWIPIHGSNFAGNVLRYGAGFAYNIVLTEYFRVAPVNEFVGWSVLGGKQSDPDPNAAANGQKDAGGQTIVNYKIGLRIGLGDYRNPGGGSQLNDRHSFYFGYGRAVTGEHWYRDMFRVEYNYWF